MQNKNSHRILKNKTETLFFYLQYCSPNFTSVDTEIFKVHAHVLDLLNGLWYFKRNEHSVATNAHSCKSLRIG